MSALAIASMLAAGQLALKAASSNGQDPQQANAAAQPAATNCRVTGKVLSMIAAPARGGARRPKQARQ